MVIMLNFQSPVPLYQQLAGIISEKIKADEYPSGARLPSEHVLAKMYGIGRPTVRQATEQLLRKGLVERRRGSGTYVKQKLEEVDLFSLAGTSSAFKKKGIDITTHIVSAMQLKIVKDDRENPLFNKKAYFFSRLSVVQEAPLLIEDLYFDPLLFNRLDQFNIQGYSISRIVEERYFMKPVSAKQNFRIGYISGVKAKKLAVSEKEPVLIVKRYLNFKNGENAIYSALYCKTDQFVFSQMIGGGASHE
jgi:GntR family transcriptional regulator